MSRFANISQAAAVVNTYILDTKMVAIWAKLKKKKQREGRIVDEDTTTQTRSRVDEDTTTQTDRKTLNGGMSALNPLCM